ncbi:PIG-L deacetylase family protein [Pseudomonas sp. EA_35y_Pfl2_R5]|uniref:PIG-L deacetylase family protein n=1 Tax=Pseudomonas sp. EA_35y_Pfl2_R5 TaxID=3088690 RepID=UPI0030DA2A8A
MSEHVNLIQGQGTSAQAWASSQRLAALPLVSLDELIAPGSRLAIVAPHPDDEVLSCGGLLAQLAAKNVPIKIVAVTDGEGSHPHSTLWPADSLRAIRQRESRTALRCLGLSAQRIEWARLHLLDSKVAHDEPRLRAHLEQALPGCSHVITTWRADAHCDHDVVGRVTAAVAQTTGARLYEMPVWAWHWATPEDSRIPWERACKFQLDEQTLARKRLALRAHRSQLLADPSTGAAPILTERTLARFSQPYEVYFR